MSRFPSFAFLGIAAAWAAAEQAPSAPTAAVVGNAKPPYVQMADSVMARDPNPLTLDSEKPAWNYTQGPCPQGRARGVREDRRCALP